MKVGIDLGGSHIAIGVVNDKGKIIEIGNHNELVEKNEFYSKMWKDYQKSI